MSCIAPAVLADAASAARRFAEATPFRHVQIDGFLDPALCEALRRDFPGFEARHALNEMGEVGGKAVRMDVRDISDAYRRLDAYLQTREFLDYVSIVTGIPGLLYDPDYVGGGTHENRHGQGLDAHVDFNYHPRTRWHRRLNLIVYLNPEWDEAWGGSLELHSDPWNAAANRTLRVPPLFNKAVIFETNEVSWHGFAAIDLPPERRELSRKSFAIYLYTRERPAAETAPPHATIYVPDAMPEQFAIGHVLDASDLRDLHARFTRLRTQLRYLYEREKDFGAQIAGYEYALAEARAAQRFDLQGHATQSGAPQGLWPDQWAAEAVELRFTPTRRARGITLDLWSPPQLGTEQQVSLELAGRRWTQVLRPGLSTEVNLAVDLSAGTEQVLSIRAARSFSPAASGESGDARALAYRLLAARLD